MGHEVSKLYEKYAQFQRLGPGQFAEIMAGIHIVETAEESKELNLQNGPMIIIAASGMLTGGRVLHHLKAFADNPKNILLLAGFQSPGTRGWKLLNGESQVKVHGMMIDVLMKIIPSDSFSAHGDKVDLLNWLKTAIQRPEKIFLVHGEPSSSEALKLTIQKDLGLDVQIAEMNQFVSV
ncbi:Ribonuclease [compost metagenome]